MTAALQADNAERSRCGLSPVQVRVEIHSGRAVVGNIGAPSRVNYTVVGDVANVAERLEELARGVAASEDDACACILVGDATARELGTGFALVPLGHHALRGRSGLLDVFRLRA
jgi:class 3 adenylate cyclase